MNTVGKRLANDLEHRICSHISRGNDKAYQIIATYHMKEIKEIRKYMSDVLSGEYYDPRTLNVAFHMAVSALNINLSSLLSEDVQVVSDIKGTSKLAM